jgi:two-component system, NarL family, invasion response regulator UvrY
MTIASPIRVLLAEDHPLVRQSLRTILQAFPNVLIVGESITGEEAVVSAGTLQPNIVLMDINMPLLDGIAATRMIKTRYPHVAVIGLTCHTPEYLVYAMTKAGAFEVLPKEKALDLYEVMQRAVGCSSAPKGASASGDYPSKPTSLEH